MTRDRPVDVNMSFPLPGRNRWWHFGITIFLFAGLYIAGNMALFSGVEHLHVLLHQQYPELFSARPLFQLFDMKNGWPDAPVMSGVLLFSMFMVSIIIAIPILALTITAVHRRSLVSVFGNLGQGFDRAQFWHGFLSAAIALFIVTCAEIVLFWDTTSFTFNWSALSVYLPVAILLVPLQVLAEEAVFRGYLLQMISFFSRRLWLRILVPAIPFALLHNGNAEVQNAPVMALGYFIILSLYLTWLSLRTGGIAAAVGFHLAMNVFAMFVLTSSLSAYLSPTLFYIDAPSAGVFPVEIIIVIALFHYLMKHKGLV